MSATLTGLDKLKERLAKYAPQGRPMVKAGVLAGAKNADGELVAEYAAVQEFGTKGIPSRPFLRLTFQHNKGKWAEILGKSFAAGYDAATALDFVGGEMKMDIVATIKSILPPPNSAKTTAMKRRLAPASVGKTLQFTGTLLHSIEYEVNQ